VQSYDTFRGFLHKIYPATMDGKGREGTYNFFLTTTGEGQPGAGHRTQGAAAPPPATPLALHHHTLAR